MKHLSRILYSALLVLTPALAASAAEPADYYSSCENKNGRDLLVALCSVTSNGFHTISYDGLLDIYPETDAYPDGKLWDMYSTKHWSPSTKCGNYKNVGDCYNREHSFPKSWFNEASPMKSDAFHVIPTDGKVNGQRSNHPYGECDGGTRLASSNGIDALGKLGNSTFAGYSGTVFEPDDQYKGDMARAYFYMAARYNDKIKGFNSDMLADNNYPVFTTWAINLLLKWHRQDPVSQKEIDRNEAVYKHQKNRNPFIDHPELAEYIWGNKTSQKWTYNAGATPQITLPADGSTLDLGLTAVGVSRSTTIAVKGVALQQNISASISPSGTFSCSPTSLAYANATSTQGAPLTITYNPTALGTHTATLTLSSGSTTNVIHLKASAVDGLPMSAPTNIRDDGFDIHWVNVGDADANGCYTLTISDVDGLVDGYPRKVSAAVENLSINDLMPSTTYFVVLESVHFRAQQTVNTVEPIPSITIENGDDIAIDAEPGTPSDPIELSFDIENIFGNFTVSVAEPFQLSTDKASWTTSLTLSPDEDRCYLRLFSNQAGIFESSIVVAYGSYRNDNTEVTGTVSATPTFIEDFETELTGTDGSYSDHTYQGNAARWLFVNAGIWANSNPYNGRNCARLGSNSNSALEMDEDVTNGMGTISFYARGWSDKEKDATILAQYSTDGGNTWTSAGTAVIAGTQYQQYTFVFNTPGKVRMRLQQTEGKRVCIDDIEASKYTASAPDLHADNANTWDAFCRHNMLVVETQKPAHVAVHHVASGITYINTSIHAGSSTFSLPSGLYIVVIGNNARRVLVK